MKFAAIIKRFKLKKRSADQSGVGCDEKSIFWASDVSFLPDGNMFFFPDSKLKFWQ